MAVAPDHRMTATVPDSAVGSSRSFRESSQADRTTPPFPHTRIFKNAAANLGRGSTSALIALLLPAVLVRHMAPASYAVWVLALQVVSYTGYLDFGLQTAVGRYIAFANQKQDSQLRDSIFSTAFTALGGAALVGLGAIIVLALWSNRIFPTVPQPLLVSMRATMVIVGLSVLIGLPVSAWNGVAVGLQRYEIPALTNVAGKLVSLVALIWAAVTGKSLIWMAIIMALANMISYALQFAIVRRLAPDIRLSRRLVTSRAMRELADYCFSLTVWSFSMLLVTGFDLILVGRFQFAAVIPYSVAATAVTFLAGAQYAIFGVIMPHAAELHAQQNADALGRLLVTTTRLGVLLLVATGMPLIVFAAPIIRIWIGSQFAHDGSRILIILVIANMVRLVGAPYSSILIGTGQQRLVTISPVMEGVSNLASSVILGMKYGAVGVATGTLIGAVVGMMGHIFYNVPRTQNHIRIMQRRFIFSAIGLPLLAASPLLTLGFQPWRGPSPPPVVFAIALVTAIVASTALVLYSNNDLFSRDDRARFPVSPSSGIR